MKRFRHSLYVLALAPLVATSCSDNHTTTTVVVEPGIVVADFQSIADYLDNEVVQSLFGVMPRHKGSSPPSVAARYMASGTIIDNVGPVDRSGESAIAEFCLGTAAGSRIDVTVIDVSAREGGARSFIEGAGDQFTVYTAFRSVRTLDTGTTCEIHVVNVYSGRIEADGSLSDLHIGQGNVGIIGTCGDALVGVYQVTAGKAGKSNKACPDEMIPGGGPDDPGRVLVEVENALVTDILVFFDLADTPALEIPALSVDAIEVAPGFVLDFETLQPIAGQDEDGSDLLMGEIFGGIFPPDPTPAGGSQLYIVENQVGVDTYFAPLPLNQTDLEVFSVVNIGVDIPGYPAPAGSGLDCLCALPPGPDPYVIGYYSYDLPAFGDLPRIIAPSEANVHFFNVLNESQLIARFDGPFSLEDATGTVVIRIGALPLP